MIDNILLDYMQRRMSVLESEPDMLKTLKRDNAFVTISRQYGCPSKLIAHELQQRISTLSKKGARWKIINKEIIESSARELGLNPEKIKYVFDAEQKTTMDEVLGALTTRYYKNDRRIRKTIREVVENIASQGEVILIGRAGVAITNDYKNALHIRLFAPQHWRLNKIMEHMTFPSEKEAFRQLRLVDKKRTDLINHFSGSTFDFNKFDLKINCQRFTPKEAADIIASAMVTRGLLT